MIIEPYQVGSGDTWDAFVQHSSNGTFLFERGYMDYHRDRFDDYSLVVRDPGGTVVALLPAHRNETTIISHAGLTYGGFVVSEAMKLPVMLAVFDATFAHLREAGFSSLVYKTIPFIYHRIPAEQDRYALFLADAALVRRGMLTVVDSRHPLPMQERRRRGIKKARQNGLTVSESTDWPAFWKILSERLLATYNTRPVHTLEEIQTLHSRFPGRIRLFAAFEEGGMRAGIVIFETDRVARVQYIAGDERGLALGGVDLIVSVLLSEQYRAKPYFDFGTSDEENGRRINKGLIDQKEGYGARVVAQDHYQINLLNYRPAQFTGAIK